MKKDGVIYYNFPVTLLKDFWCDDNNVAHNRLEQCLYCYAIYIWNKKYYSKNKPHFYEIIRKELGVTQFYYTTYDGLRNSNYDYYLKIYHQYDGAYFSISTDMFYNFYNRNSTQEDRIILLAYLAIKSILGTREYSHTNKYFILSRMACNTKFETNIPEEINKYSSRRLFDKLKRKLYEVHNVAIYTNKKMRGCYVSLKKDESGKPDILWLAKKALEDCKKRKIDTLKEAIREASGKLKFDST